MQQQRILPRHGRRALLDVVREQGRTLSWLARKSGYSERHVARVARGEHPGTRAFHVLMMRLLGEEYDLPAELAERKERPAPRQLSFGETFLPAGIWGKNTLEAIMRAQGIRRPQSLPRSRPRELDDETIDEFLHALEELGR